MDAAEDEKKPFDAEVAAAEEALPDPDEHLMLDQGSGKAWLVKVPKFLMERWAAVDEDDKHLATIRIYNAKPNDPQQKPRIILFLPPNRDPINAPQSSQSQSQMPTPPGSQTLTPPPSQPPKPVGPSLAHPQVLDWPAFDFGNTIPTTGSEPDIYELEMVNENVENQIIVAERPKDPGFIPPGAAPANSRARTTILTGRIKHECNLRPSFSATYRKQMRERHRKYNTPTRQVMRIEDAGVSGGRGGINRLSSGVGVGAGGAFSDLVRTKPKPTKGTFERMARMPRNQLLDNLFSLFREQQRWSIKPLRERTQQPEVYLKEVLSDIAFLHRSGEHNGLWELKANFKDDLSTIKPEDVPGPSGSGAGDVKMEDMDDDDEEEEDDDMEEVS
ncbi:hypothetical protein CC1G_09096 [Coprinopsis cinerea okayama7|uniref:Transcription initiation factor IIF subunit beta n=1 Tax=Coprinopsis cinerea (strain Okayama-7 / 130 / ATCC MYA-4618 / FGSC 9003) TaxID=240176 RepID=A8P342_COPC7|nr:hypothetical protein CC1G_09096 [Coprinopsis cinerea okayama7\|eukprot:XP_001838468.1 hypothetical protein CC1G_09096 [Coprinopsis cinerea okayama7\